MESSATYMFSQSSHLTRMQVRIMEDRGGTALAGIEESIVKSSKEIFALLEQVGREALWPAGLQAACLPTLLKYA